MLPLEGITVVALEQAVAAPYATRQLADLGARVIKIERAVVGDFARNYDTEVNGLSSYFAWLNRGKESVTLDIKNSEDQLILDSMLSQADVFIHNLIPGAVDRLGLGDRELRSRHSRLITCAISGYGHDGPYEHRKAYDLLIQCEVGFLSITGSPESPAKAGISIADISAGMFAYSGILAALYEREKTGEGTSLQVSLLDSLGEWMSQPYLFSHYGGNPVKPAGAEHSSIAPYGPFSAGDGSTVFIGVQNEREWEVLCSRILNNPELAKDERFATNSLRVKNRKVLNRIIEEALTKFSSAEMMKELDEIGIANARLRTMEEFAQHPQLAARDRWRDVDSPVGPIRLLLPPVIVAGREPKMKAIPSLGEHSARIRAEFGGSHEVKR